MSDNIEEPSEGLTGGVTDEVIYLEALNHTKDKLLSIVGHDIRSAIGGVISLVTMLEKRLDSGDLEDARRLTGLIRRSSHDADDLLRDLVSWTRNHGKEIQFHLEEIDVHELIQEEVARLEVSSKRKGVGIRMDQCDVGVIKGDRHMLQVIFRNLLTNAVKFSHPNSEVVVKATPGVMQWKFEVIDNGVGMGEDIQKLLLKIDKRKQRTGTSGEASSGLGLLLCEEFIQRHGGLLKWKSAPNEGSNFSFTVPELIA